MNAKIQTRIDSKRGCGWRKEGGLYLVAGGLAAACGKLPLPLEKCPCCGGGVKFSRGWTWINVRALAAGVECQGKGDRPNCFPCPLNGQVERAGLLWVGEKFYSPAEFTSEAARLGVSKRISAIPRDFKLGETWIALAHISAIVRNCLECGAPADLLKLNAEACSVCDGGGEQVPGIFHLFRPSAIEYICTGKESDAEIDAMIERGITPVVVQKSKPQAEMSLSV